MTRPALALCLFGAFVVGVASARIYHAGDIWRGRNEIFQDSNPDQAKIIATLLPELPAPYFIAERGQRVCSVVVSAPEYLDLAVSACVARGLRFGPEVTVLRVGSSLKYKVAP